MTKALLCDIITSIIYDLFTMALYTYTRSKKYFAEKMFEAEDIILERYDILKNYILSFKKIKSRISNTADTFNMGRTKLAKLSVTGKSLNKDFYIHLPCGGKPLPFPSKVW